MNSFRFNFSCDETATNEDAKAHIDWAASEKLTVPEDLIKNLETIVKHAKIFACGDVEIGHVSSSDVVINLNNETAVKSAEDQQSDLITGKYEGGLKIWECTYDLVDYLEQNKSIKLENPKVLDLGCGAGILGIYAFMNNSFVTFQDYNKEVLENLTMSNLLLNIDEDNRASEINKCKFYSGDWASFNNLLSDTEVFDVILTSETIYNQENYDKLIKLFVDRLNKNGIVYVAAKTYYFGVGGGTRQFESHVAKYADLKSEVCWKSSGGIQREILKIVRK